MIEARVCCSVLRFQPLVKRARALVIVWLTQVRLAADFANAKCARYFSRYLLFAVAITRTRVVDSLIARVILSVVSSNRNVRLNVSLLSPFSVRPRLIEVLALPEWPCSYLQELLLFIAR